MKYILIKGAKNEGKSTTIDAVCRALNPDRVARLKAESRTLEPFVLSESSLYNGCFILEVEGKIVLVSAGATTEHGTAITLLVKIVIELKGKVDFAIVAMRSREHKDGFDTPAELNLLGEDMGTVYINKIPDDYENTEEWRIRIQGIVDKFKEHGLITGEEVMVG